MKGDKKRTLMPKLRFPEFHGGPGWEERHFSDLYDFGPTNNLSREKLNYKAGIVKNIHYGDIHSRFQPLFKITGEVVPFVSSTASLSDFSQNSFVREGDVLFADASEDLVDVGKSIEIVALDGQLVLSGMHTILAKRKGGELIVGFGGHVFQSHRLRAQIRKEAQGAKVFGISPGRLARVSVCFPPTHAEQKKIAACLASLDELIAGQGRKLDALRVHKKGLVQELFPRERETRPRLRFPEFHDARPWDDTSLGQIADFSSGGTPSKDDPDFWNGSIPWVSAKDMKQLFLYDTADHITANAIANGAKQVPQGTVLILTRGMTLLKDIPICFLQRPMSFNQDIKALRPKAEIHGRFLSYLLLANKQRILSMVDVAGHGTGRLDTEKLKALDVLVPRLPEQERIATCLALLEDLIPAELEKLAALKTHKRGLLQHLFPSPKGN